MAFVVRWTQPPGTVDLAGYNVYRALVSNPQKNEDWTKLNSVLIEVLYYKDDTHVREPQLVYYYRITWEDSLGVESSLDSAISVTYDFSTHSEIQYIAEEIKRRHTWVLERHGSKEQVDIYVEKRAGVKCDCWDVERRRSSLGDSCPKCFGKGIVGGFVLVDNQTVKIYSPKERIAEEAGGIIIQKNPTAILLDYPIVGEGDLFAVRNGDRYMVTGVMRKQISGVILYQRAELILLPYTHILQNVMKPS